jgi:cyclophilin family peptidyl-prolyl cis-trans isomerase
VFRQIIPILAVGLASAGSLLAKAPAAPSNLRVKALGVNSFLLEWTDNSKNEKGWEVRVSKGVTKRPERFQLIASPNITSYVLITAPVAGSTLSFQLAAYNGAAGAEVFSKRTSTVTVKAFEKKTFGNPTSLVARTLDDGRIRLTWAENSTSEHGYQIEAKKGFGKWEPVGIADAGVKFSMKVVNFEPGTSYSLRVRAFKTYPQTFSKYSNVASANTLTFQPPDNLVATPGADGTMSLKWKDRSSVEAGYEIETKTGTAAFAKIGEVGADAASTSAIKNFTLDTDYQFRIRAVRFVNLARVYSDYSPVATAKTTLLATPSALAGTVLSNTSIKLTWKDDSARELYFVVQRRRTGTTEYTNAGSVGENVKEYTVTGLTPGARYDFRVGSADLSVTPSYSSSISLQTTGGALDLDKPHPIFWNTSFSHQIGVTNAAALQSMEVTGLPAGLTFDPATRTISGTTFEEGVKSVEVKGTFLNSAESTGTLVLRIIRPPAAPLIGSAFDTVNLNVGSATSVSTTGKFSDPDAADARRVTTTLGNFDIVLYPQAAPVTVANFLNYANAGRYNGSFFHRSPDNFVVQGGGYLNSGTTFSEVSKFASIANEPGVANTSGTVAMAKVAGNPNSATSEFFVNVADNTSVLDSQNGGFTVFGRVAGTGMTVVDAINALPRKDYTISVSGSSRTLEDVPMNVPAPAPDAIDPAKLVKVSSVAAVPVLRYEVQSANPAIATAVVDGSDVDVTGVSSGSTTITVKAIDLDNQMTSQTFGVGVSAP